MTIKKIMWVMLVAFISSVTLANYSYAKVIRIDKPTTQPTQPERDWEATWETMTGF